MEVRDGHTNHDIRVRYTHTYRMTQEECEILRESVS